MLYRHNRMKLNDGWRFRFADEYWDDVRLPHTWNAFDTMHTDPAHHYRRGVGVYEKDFNPPSHFRGQTLWLEFEAVAQHAKIYFDDTLLCEHHGGYTAFTVQIPNRIGTLKVEADNTPNPDLIPSDMSDFFLYGGITRNIWLFATDTAWIETSKCETVATRTHGELIVHLSLGGNYQDIAQIAVTLTGIGFRADFHTNNNRGNYTQREVIALPQLNGDTYKIWSPDQPNLYQLRLELYDKNGHLCDAIEQRIGFRWFEFPEYDAFYLNGERLLLKGTHRHEDWAGYGGAVPDDITRREFEMMKAAGFNFIRLGHYPQSRATLETCDELGILVWEEIPWCRGGVGEDAFKQYTRTMLQEMIQQHINYPSIIFWGLGNELDWESEHPASTDDKVRAFLSELHNTSHQLDPSRLTALRRFEYGADVVDVYSPSIWAGWYRGNYTDYEDNLRTAIEKYPRFIHAEWGGDSHVGRHLPPPHIQATVASTVDNAEEVGTATSSIGFARYSKDGDWSESYIIDLMAWHLKVQQAFPNLAGTLQWAFKDFGTPLRPENPLPYINQKGLIDRLGKPKDVYYLFKAYQTQTPVVHIESNYWQIRPANTPHTIRVMSNQSRIELFIDKVSYGILDIEVNHPLNGFVWDVTLSEGEHIIRAVSDRGIEHEIQCTARPLGQTASSLKVEHFVQNESTVVTVQLIDDKQRYVQNDERFIEFSSKSGQLQFKNLGATGHSVYVQTSNGFASLVVDRCDSHDISVTMR